MRITYQGTQDRSGGYGTMGHYLYRELVKLGVEMVDYEGRDGEVPETIVWGAPPNHIRHWWKGQRSVIITMWETQTIPATFRCNLDAFDMVIVPSQQNLEMFSAYHPNVRYVPLGVDTDLWHFTPRKTDGPFTFLTLANSPRKGNRLMAKAFCEVFGNDQNVRLIVLDPKQQVRRRDNVITIQGPVPEAELVAMYENANCYLGASRGEGFGFQPIQAIAQGCPTILTNAHGQAQYAHLGIPIPAGSSQSWGFCHGDAGMWWEPDFDTLCKAMRDVYEHYDEHCAYAAAMATRVAQEWTWEAAGQILLDTLGDLDKAMIPKTTEVDLPQRLYRMRVTQRTKCMIAGVNFDFKPGIDYDEVSDVKRVIFDAGLLDPECIDITEPGFLPGQLELTHAGT